MTRRINVSIFISKSLYGDKREVYFIVESGKINEYSKNLITHAQKEKCESKSL